ncbi:hypothetical protein ACW6QP_10910 [Salegentibacter sp. HM20]
MKRFFIIPVLMLALVSCKNETDQNVTQVDDIEQTDDFNIENQEGNDQNRNSTGNPPSQNNQGRRDIDSSQPDRANNSTRSGSTSGKYTKVDESDATCNCYCLDVVEGGTTEMCLRPDEIYITARVEKGPGSEIHFYYTQPSSRNTNTELPWEDFDKNQPIAIMLPGENGQMDLDWKGFHIDGQLATDYAIYGKKTLEGNYKRQ